MDKEKLLKSGIIEQYVLGLASEEDRKLVEEYARTYPEVRAEIEEMQQALEAYINQHSIPPPPELKEQVLSDVQEVQRMQQTHSSYRFDWKQGLLVACLIGFFLVAYFSYQHKQEFNRKYSSLVDQYNRCAEENSTLKSEQQLAINRYNTLLEGTATHVHLSGTDLNPAAQAVVYWNPEEGEAKLHATHLPHPPDGHQYQIWADVEGKMINAGLINFEKAQSFQSILFIDRAESLNITIEPEGGSEHPTVAMLYANGKVNW